MSKLLSPAEERCQAAHRDALRHNTYRSRGELALRDALERWARDRYPEARLVHELVMGRGKVRADMAAIEPHSLVAFEIKSWFDDVTRLLHQCMMYRLAVPELWLVTLARHRDDCDLVRWLAPSIGLLLAHPLPGGDSESGPYRLEVAAEAGVIDPHPEALLHLCWVAELAAIAGYQGSRTPTHAQLVKSLLADLEPQDRLAGVCRQLRARDALWRADPPIRDGRGHG